MVRMAYFDISVQLINSFAPTYASSPLAQCYHQAELNKKKIYDKRVYEVERGISPLVFHASGGMCPTATIAPPLLFWRRGVIPIVMYCKLCFSLLCSAVMCLQESRSCYYNIVNQTYVVSPSTR